MQQPYNECKLFYQALNAVLEILLDDDIVLEDCMGSVCRIYGRERMDVVMGLVDGAIRFYVLTPTRTSWRALIGIVA